MRKGEFYPEFDNLLSEFDLNKEDFERINEEELEKVQKSFL